MGVQTVQEYVIDQFRIFAQPMWPNGVPWGELHHRDIVLTFLAGAFIMDQNKTLALTRMLEISAVDEWRPGSEWNWPTAEQN